MQAANISSVKPTTKNMNICDKKVAHLALDLSLHDPGNEALVLLDDGLQPGVLILPLVPGTVSGHAPCHSSWARSIYLIKKASRCISKKDNHA